MKRLVLVDGTALVYRSFFAFIRNPLKTRSGEETSAAYGVATALLKIRREYAPDYLAFLLDSKEPTFRHAAYPEYKATREKMPEELVRQFPRVREVVAAMPVPIIEWPGVEADDVMGTLARRAEREGHEVWLATGDKDMLQLVTERVRVLVPGREGSPWALLDAGGVRDRIGVAPERVIDLLALMGDASDNIPGVRGVGEKTARKLLDQMGSFDAILAAPERAPGAKLQEALRTHREEALLSKDLVTIRTDLPLDVPLESLALRDLDRAALGAVFRALEFHRLADQIGAPEAAPPPPAAEASPAGPAAGRVLPGAAGAALSLFDSAEAAPPAAPRLSRTPGYRTVSEADELPALAAELARAGRFAVDTETTSEEPMEADLVGISLAWREGEAVYLPIGHAGGGNVPLDAVRERLGPLFRDESVAKVGQNAKYDMLVLGNHDLPLAGVRCDTMVASFLLEPQERQHNLDRLAQTVLGHRMIPIDALIGKATGIPSMDGVAIPDATEYACEDADVTLQLATRFEKGLSERGLLPLFERIEMPLVPVLASMEKSGVNVDTALLASLSSRFESEIGGLVREVHRLAGHPFNLNSTRELGRVLFEELGLPAGRSTKSGFSTDQDTLERLASEHELPRKILGYRHLAKLRSTYVEALPKLVNPRTGRIHTSFHQTVAATGRLSSSDPNLQNIPVRTAIGREIRRAFRPRESGWEMASLDYSQIELRILAHVTGDPTLSGAFHDGADIHRRTAARVLKIAEDAVTDEDRDRAKAVNFGIIYGMGALGLAARLGISRVEAKEFIDDYFATYPRVKAWIDATIAGAKERREVTTLAGRIRPLPELSSPNRGLQAFGERIAVNTVIQGSAADMMKIAMIAVDRLLGEKGRRTLMVIQVHDELVFEGPSGELGEVIPLAQEAMAGALPLDVPVLVHAGRGANWAEVS